MKIEFNRIPIIGKVLQESPNGAKELAVETDNGVQLVLEELIADCPLSQVYKAKKISNNGSHYLDNNLVVKLASERLLTEEEEGEKFAKLLYLQESLMFALFPSLSPEFSRYVPKIYDTIGLKNDSKYPGIVMEELFGESLLERQMTFNENLEVMIELGTIIKEMHKNGFVHRDISPKNVHFRKIYKRGEITSGVVLIDGGFAYHSNFPFANKLNFEKQFNLGTPVYMDELAIEGYIFQLSDAYAYAMTIGEVLTGLDFGEDGDAKPTLESVRKRKYVPNKISRQIPFIDDLLARVFNSVVELRPYAGEIVEVLQKIYSFYHDKRYVPEYLR